MFGKKSAGREFNKCAINIGKAIKALKELEPKVFDEQSCKEHIYDILVVAYIYRLGVLDKIDKNESWYDNNLPIMIPSESSLFGHKKENFREITHNVYDRILNISKYDKDNYDMTNGILNRGGDFDDFDELIDENFKNEIN